jgi:cysteine desulfurase/selenocysteine lyase
MTDVTPDLIAEIATRLLNEGPQTSTAAIADSPTDQVDGADAYVTRRASFSPSVASVPQTSRFSPIAANQFGATQFVPAGVPEIVGHFPTAAPTEVPAGNLHEIADVSPDGLRRFVDQIRNPASPTELGFFAGSPGLTVPQQFFSQKKAPIAVPSAGARPLDTTSIRREFPALNQRVHGKPLVWFDNAATTQKPQAVIDAISRYYAHDNSNIHRAAHTLAARSTDAFEGVRDKVQKFLGAATKNEIIFVRGTTEGINLVAQTYGRKYLQPGDEILLSTLEHHANIVPWQLIAKERGAVIRVIPVNDRGEVMLEQYQSLLGPRTKLVGLTQASNSLGTILPVTEMTQMAKRYGARVIIDGAQSVSHMPVNVQDIGCDFFVFSGHKIFGPTGIGVVYAREELQEIMPPWQGGGNMIKNVTFEETSYADPPAKFEAGTPNIADTVGLGAALDYVQRLGLSNIGKHEHFMLEYATERLLPINGLRLIGQAREKVSVISFVLKDRRTEDIGKLLDLEGIAVRAGHHCAQPSLHRYGVNATVRPSFAFYNTTDEIDHLVAAIKRINAGSVKAPTNRLNPV